MSGDGKRSHVTPDCGPVRKLWKIHRRANATAPVLDSTEELADADQAVEIV
jgi:hypothetical protein